jgi:hypothetical protein
MDGCGAVQDDNWIAEIETYLSSCKSILATDSNWRSLTQEYRENDVSITKDLNAIHQPLSRVFDYRCFICWISLRTMLWMAYILRSGHSMDNVAHHVGARGTGPSSNVLVTIDSMQQLEVCVEARHDSRRMMNFTVASGSCILPARTTPMDGGWIV